MVEYYDLEDHVSFEIAKLLKEKGFNWECIGYYVDSEPNKLYYSFLGEVNSTWEPRCCSAPTLQMTMKWLREIHRLKINTWYENTLRNGHYETWNSEVCDKYDDLYDLGHYDTYEQAADEAIKYCLENLI